MKKEEQAIVEMLTEYIGNFVVDDSRTWDAQVIAPYYVEPAMLINSERVIPLPTHTQLTAVFGAGVKGLIAAHDYARTVPKKLTVKQVSETLGIAHSLNVRYQQNGEEIERFGTTFILFKQEDRWKISVLMDHDADAELASMYKTKIKKNDGSSDSK